MDDTDKSHKNGMAQRKATRNLMQNANITLPKFDISRHILTEPQRRLSWTLSSHTIYLNQ